MNNHVVRGVKLLFCDDRDFRVFLRLVEDARVQYQVSILGYCLMGNHFHLVVVSPQANLDRFMKHFQSRYARYYNERYDRSGAVFQARYHNNLIATDGQLQFSLRYVDRNPLELGIDITSYPWASYAFYSEFRSGRNEIVTIDSRWVLAFAGSLAQYRHFIETDSAHDRFRRSDGTRRIAVANEVSETESLRALIRIVSELTGKAEHEVTTSRRGRTNDARLLAFLVAASSGISTDAVMAELACRAQSTYSTTVDRARRRRSESPHFAALADAIESRWKGDQRAAA